MYVWYSGYYDNSENRCDLIPTGIGIKCGYICFDYDVNVDKSRYKNLVKE